MNCTYRRIVGLAISEYLWRTATGNKNTLPLVCGTQDTNLRVSPSEQNFAFIFISKLYILRVIYLYNRLVRQSMFLFIEWIIDKCALVILYGFFNVNVSFE